MGGKGTFADGNNVPFTYETAGQLHGIKILKGLNGKHGLPEESHSSSSYISLYKDGNVKQIRVYDKGHNALIDIEYSVHQGKKTLHAHDYVDGERQKKRELSLDEVSKYGKFFGGVQ